MKNKNQDPFRHDKKVEHPSFVTVQFSRVTSSHGKSLFGSSVKSHSWIEMRVCPASLRHGLGTDRVHGSLASILNVALSPAQFAELLTTLNVGGGVPGTLQSFDGKQIEQLEVTESESKRVREHYEKMLKVKRAEVKEEIKAIEAEMDEKKTLTIDLKKRIKAVLESLTVQSEGSMPFYIDQFQEATERVVVQAKAEVDAFVTHAIQQTGLEQLRAQAPRIEASVHDDGKIPYEKS